MSTAAPSSTAPPSDAARELARRLYARAIAGDGGAHVASIERMCSRALGSLSRWFGPFGASSLATRALARAQANAASLQHVSIVGDPSPSLSGFAESWQEHGAAAAAEGGVVFVAALADLVGRLIGDDLAENLLEHEPPAASGLPAEKNALRAPTLGRSSTDVRPKQPG